MVIFFHMWTTKGDFHSINLCPCRAYTIACTGRAKTAPVKRTFGERVEMKPSVMLSYAHRSLLVSAAGGTL